MKDVIIFDLDNTLADVAQRLWALPKKDEHLTRSWDEFNSLAEFDVPIQDNIDLCNALHRSGLYQIVIVTGRNEVVRESTVAWLNRHHVYRDALLMRSLDDNRKDTAVKEDILRDIGLDRILCAFDDLPHVVEHFRKLGITTHQVTEHADKERTDLKPHGSE